MAICSECRHEYDDQMFRCPECATLTDQLGPVGRYALAVGMIFSIIGVLVAFVLGGVAIYEGNIWHGAAWVLLVAPYSFAMYIVFKFVSRKA